MNKPECVSVSVVNPKTMNISKSSMYMYIAVNKLGKREIGKSGFTFPSSPLGCGERKGKRKRVKTRRQNIRLGLQQDMISEQIKVMEGGGGQVCLLKRNEAKQIRDVL